MSWSRATTFLSLFTSMSTLLCCALPALLVTLGFGVIVAGAAANIPGLVWLSEHKLALFIIGGLLLSVSWYLQQRANDAPCPLDRDQAQSCMATRLQARRILKASIVIYSIGIFFAYLAPLIMSAL